MAPDPPSNHRAADQEAWSVVISRVWGWMEALPAIETSVKLILTLTKLEVKFKSCDSLKTLLLMKNMLCKYHFNAVTWNYISDSKQNVLYYFLIKHLHFFYICIHVVSNNFFRTFRKSIHRNKTSFKVSGLLHGMHTGRSSPFNRKEWVRYECMASMKTG